MGGKSEEARTHHHTDIQGSSGKALSLRLALCSLAPNCDYSLKSESKTISIVVHFKDGESF
eukprot:5884913-Amphidinium_carterae.1